MTIKETIDRCREILAQRTDLISPAGVVGSTPALSIGDMADLFQALPSLLDRLDTAERLLGEAERLCQRFTMGEWHATSGPAGIAADRIRAFLSASKEG